MTRAGYKIKKKFVFYVQFYRVVYNFIIIIVRDLRQVRHELRSVVDARARSLYTITETIWSDIDINIFIILITE